MMRNWDWEKVHWMDLEDEKWYTYACWILECCMRHIAFHLITSHKYILYCQAGTKQQEASLPFHMINQIRIRIIWQTDILRKHRANLIQYTRVLSDGYVIWIISELQMHSTNLNVCVKYKTDSSNMNESNFHIPHSVTIKAPSENLLVTKYINSAFSTNYKPMTTVFM